MAYTACNARIRARRLCHNDAVIRVRGLCKHFKVHRRPPGLWPAVRSLFRREYELVRAVDGVDFTIEAGERVGFLGPNGAGKTTTLKVLSGLLHPSAGEVEVDGFEPRRRAREFLSRITLVMGQKQQLIWDLPPNETYALNRAIFDISESRFRENLATLSELLDIGDLSNKPTRQLSLGERMKCELVAALLHRPGVLFLDEPTIGLDVAMQAAVRGFIRDYNQRHGATVLLTSHYMDDVTALCSRVIIIDHGRIIHDGDLNGLVKAVQPDKLVSFSARTPMPRDTLERMGLVLSDEGGRIALQVARDRLRDVVSQILESAETDDLSVEDPPLEDVLRQLFKGEPQ
jgi:ABC-2 type transport system ATP-binding protein